jgi:Ring finger domain
LLSNIDTPVSIFSGMSSATNLPVTEVDLYLNEMKDNYNFSNSQPIIPLHELPLYFTPTHRRPFRFTSASPYTIVGPTIIIENSIDVLSDNNEVKLSIEKYSGNECVCSLCIENIENGTDIYRLKCNHIFHSCKCLENKGIIDWINEHKTCPYCRAKIVNNPIEGNYTLVEDEIECVMSLASTSRINAIQALRRHRNMVDAIMSIDH